MISTAHPTYSSNHDEAIVVEVASAAHADDVASVPRPMIDRVARADCSLLLTGETGVGKGYLARRIHEQSARASAPFVPVNCGAIPEGVIDSHLFGHTRGAFSDAHKDYHGVVRSAEGGTLFLDEVGDLPPDAQRRLLRVLEEREVQPVGSPRPVSVDVRIIAATGRDLRELVERGAFRIDLFFRLNVIHLAVKPLRERPGDVAAMADLFNRECAHRHARPPLTLTAGGRKALQRHAWPGNVRQLRTVIERLHVLCPKQTIRPAELREYGQIEEAIDAGFARSPAPVLRAADAAGATRATFGVKEVRLSAARRALEACGGNISRAAAALGVHRSTVHRWLAHERVPA